MDDQPALPRPTVNPWVVLVVGSLSAFMVFLDAQVLFVAFDDIRSSFPSVSFATMSWTLSAYTIALAAALVPAGRMADRYGRRRVFLIGLVAFTLASVLCAVAPSAGLLVAFRVIQALGAAALVPASLALVLSVFPPARVPVAVAVWGAIAALAAAVGPTAGALLVEAWDWRAVFLANVPVGAIALVLGIRLLPESREADRARFPDPLGIALLAGSLTLLALGIVQSDQWGWTARQRWLPWRVVSWCSPPSCGGRCRCRTQPWTCGSSPDRRCAGRTSPRLLSRSGSPPCSSP